MVRKPTENNPIKCKAIAKVVAIQLNAIQFGGNIALVFTTVLDQRVGFADEEDEVQGLTDRSYWEKRGTKATVSMADELFSP